MKTRYLIIVLLALVYGLNSCDKVEPPYVEQVDYCYGDSKVLLEDYTGHECVNCPSAALLAHDLQANFCDRVIIMSVHAGYFARPNAYDSLFADDFRTEAGEAWDGFFGNSALGNPNGLVNRKIVDDSYVISPSNWGTTIAPLLQEPARARLSVNNTWDAANKKLTTTVRSQFLEGYEGNISLLVCLTQDNIVAAQKNNDPAAGDVPVAEDYVHMHMLRHVLNGTWGEVISNSGSVSNGDDISRTYTLDFIDEWKAADCHIVAFIYDDTSKEVIQVEEAAVTE